ncbi:MAG: hypothetical protein M0Z31_07330 [Clostridia bacterium]|nr:hypothetical protein [Clostridia bacterium]
MIIATNTVIAMRCPMCGSYGTHNLSLFSFSGKQTVQIACSCGANKISIGTKNRKSFWFQVPCVLCETKHLLYFAHKQIWSNQVLTLICTDTELDLGYIGPEDKVLPLVAGLEEDLDTIMEEMDYDDYFHNPTVMMEVLNCLHDIAEEGYLYCQCGNYQIEVDVLPERLELQCKECGSVGVLYAEDEEDLHLMRNLEVIELVKKGFKCLNGVQYGPGKGRQSRRKRK